MFPRQPSVPARSLAQCPLCHLLLWDAAAADELRAGVRTVDQLQEADVVSSSPYTIVWVLDDPLDGNIFFKFINFTPGIIAHSNSSHPADIIITL